MKVKEKKKLKKLSTVANYGNHANDISGLFLEFERIKKD